MTPLDKLTIEEVEKISDETYDFVKAELAQQLADTMRENERLKKALADIYKEAWVHLERSDDYPPLDDIQE